jgi:exopolysaccharide biosynthesis polyprenyl glycosylphosphotransferase
MPKNETIHTNEDSKLTSLDDRHETNSQSLVSTNNRRIWLPSLGLRVSERKLLLVVIDLILLSSALIISLVLRTDFLRDLISVWLNVKWFVTLMVLWGVVATLFRLYDLSRAADPTIGVLSAAGAAGFTSLIYLTIPWLTPPIVNRSQGFIFVVASTGLIGIWRFIYSQLFIQPAFQRRAIVVGAGNSGKALAQALQINGHIRNTERYYGTGHELIGFIDDDPEKANTSILGIPVLGNSSQLLEFVRDLEVDEVVVSITNTEDIQPELFEAILDCRERGIPIQTMISVYERLTGRVAFEHASRNVALATGQDEAPYLRFYGLIKRIIDLFGALVGLVFLIVLVPFVGLANALSSNGPLFFSQTRIGRGGREISVYKFRSMVPDAEATGGAVWATIDDERITAAGRWLRRTHLDELPQILNVLRGDMSLVGPRPERPEFVQNLSQQIPFYRARHSVRPGITGWAQIHQDYGDSVDGAREKLEYDLYYIKNAGPLLDTLIMLRTITKVLAFRGR